MAWQNSDRPQRFFSGASDHFSSRFEARAVTRAIPGRFSRVPSDETAKVCANRRELAKLPVLVAEHGKFLPARTDNHAIATF